MHHRISVNALCFMGTPFRELATYWKQLGAHRVSFISSLLFDEGLEAAQTALGTGDYRLETISHQFLAGALEPREEQWREPRERLSLAIGYAKTLGAQSIYMVTGGRGEGTWEQAAQWFARAIAPCVTEAKDAGIPLLVECSPALYDHSHIAHSLRDTLILAEMANIGVCADLFACWTEAELEQTLARAMPRLHLIQIGDYVLRDMSLPARAVPGDGAIPIRRFCESAVRLGYKGAFDLELLGPRIDREGRVPAVARAAANLGSILQGLGVRS
jgi:sugar phosphate isomerase/epimerase